MKLKRHPLSALFAQYDLDQADLENLAIDMTENGQQNPIALLDGKVLDGWNRYQACLIGKLEPITFDYEGGDPWKYVVSQNIARRHMTPQQIAAVYLLKRNGESVPNGTKQTVREVAQELGVGRGTAERISKVAKAEPEVQQAVIKGEASLDKAAKVAALPREQQAEAIKTPAVERRAPEPQATAEEDIMTEGMSFDPIEELERAQGELMTALAKIEKLEAEDRNKELATQIDLNAALTSRLNQAMTTNAALDRELRRMGKQHAELRKILGIDDDRQIVSAVKALKETAKK